jgi:transcriptional regulator GlxA family with amidase domain
MLPKVLDASLGLSLSIFQAANRLLEAEGKPALFEVATTAMRRGTITTGAGMSLNVATAARNLPDAVLVLGSYLTGSKDMQAWLGERDVLDASGYVRDIAARKVEIAAACAGTFVLAQAGVLNGRTATTTWWMSRYFRACFPDVRLDMQRVVVHDGNLTTAGAALAQADLVLHFVARHAGPQLAHACSRYLLLDERTSQSRFPMVQHMVLQDPQLRHAETWVRARLNQSISIPALASALHLTTRTMARRFDAALGLTPLQFVQRLRIEQALHLLRATTHSFEKIAAQVGYADPNALRRLLMREAGATPSELRRQARA